MEKPGDRTPANWSYSMKPGDLVKHKRNKTVHLVTAVREIKGRVAFFHLEGFSPQEVFYADDVKVINETR